MYSRCTTRNILLNGMRCKCYFYCFKICKVTDILFSLFLMRKCKQTLTLKYCVPYHSSMIFLTCILINAFSSKIVHQPCPLLSMLLIVPDKTLVCRVVVLQSILHSWRKSKTRSTRDGMLHHDWNLQMSVKMKRRYLSSTLSCTDVHIFCLHVLCDTSLDARPNLIIRTTNSFSKTEATHFTFW